MQSRTEECAEVTPEAYRQRAGGAASRLRASPHKLGPSKTASADDACAGRSWVPRIATRHASARRCECREALQLPGATLARRRRAPGHIRALRLCAARPTKRDVAGLAENPRPVSYRPGSPGRRCELRDDRRLRRAWSTSRLHAADARFRPAVGPVAARRGARRALPCGTR